MRLRALFALLGASACAAHPAEVPGREERALVPDRVRVRHDALDASSETAPLREAAPLKAVSLSAPPSPPAGVRCVVYGRGAGLGTPCGTTVSVVASRSATEPEANLELEGAEFAFGLFPARTKAWIHVEDDTFTVDGFVDTSTVQLALRREVDIVEDHVWLKANVAVHALGADEAGVAVKLGNDDDVIEGFEDIPARVPCEALLFDREEVPSPGTEPLHAVAYPARDTIAFFTAPDSTKLTELGSKQAPFNLTLAVLDRKPGWTRVGFETTSTRVDLWAKSHDLVEVPSWGDRIGMSGCCGGGSRRVSVGRVTALEATPVLVGFSPKGKPSGVVTLREGARVATGSRKGRFTAVTPHGWSAVTPPAGTSFWVPTDKLSPAH